MTDSPPIAPSTSAKWRNRFGCLFSIIIFILLAFLPLLGCRLIFEGEIMFGQEPTNQMRVFLLQEPGQEGIGWQWTRPVGDRDAMCSRTTVRYLMFAGEAKNANQCSCQSASDSSRTIPRGCALP